MLPMDKRAVDVLCMYCPDTDECYYIEPSAHGASVTLRLLPARNRQVVGVLLAAECRSIVGMLGHNAAERQTPPSLLDG